jgi:hypothetical protein
MLVRLFKGNSPGIIFLIAVIFIAVWLNAFIHPPPVLSSASRPMPLYGLLTSVTGADGLTGVIVSFALVAFMAFLLVNFNTTSFFITERTYFPALLYVLAGGMFPEYQTMNPALPASLFLMLAIMRIINGYRKQGLANNFFDAGLLISTGSLFYANLIWFGLLVFIGIILIRSVNVSEIAIAVIGLVTPYFILFGIYYILGRAPSGIWEIIRENLFAEHTAYHFTRLIIAAIIINSLIILVSLSYLFSLLNIKKIKSRKTFSLLIWYFLVSLAVYYIIPSVSVEIAWLSAIPCSYFMTHYFIFLKKRLMPEIFLTLIFLMVLVIQIFHAAG